MTFACPILQDNGTYDIVGIEPIVDNEAMLHHFVMYGCSDTTETPGVIIDDFNMLKVCEEAVYVWAPGTGKYSANNTFKCCNLPEECA